MDAESVRESVPSIGGPYESSPSYSIIKYDDARDDDAIYRLTIAAGLHVPEFAPEATNVVQIIHYFAKMMRDIDPNAPDVKYNRVQLGNLLRSNALLMDKLVDFLYHEPLSLLRWPSGLYLRASDNLERYYWKLWPITLGDEELVIYSNVFTIEDYVRTTLEFLADRGDTTNYDAVESEERSPAGEYVNESLIDQLRALDGSSSKWDLRKLIAMLSELNAAYAAGHPYSSIMLCRAIMDHVPPVFGEVKFSQVVDMPSLNRGDRNHLKQLSNNRFTADDALHRHISRWTDIIEIQDVPVRMGINTLVRLVIDKFD